MAKKKAPQQDFLTFTAGSDIGANASFPERNLGEELYKKNWQSKTIDDFEKSVGIQPKQKKQNLSFKSRIFSPSEPKEQALMNELMNNPKFAITYWKDNWTSLGQYNVFIIYSENLDYKTPEQQIKEIAS